MEKSMKIPDIVEMFHQVLAIMAKDAWDDETIRQCTEAVYIKIHDKTVMTLHGCILYVNDLVDIFASVEAVLVKCAETYENSTDIPTIHEYIFQALIASRYILNLTANENRTLLQLFIEAKNKQLKQG